MQVQKIELTGLGFGGDFAAEESYKTLLSNIQFCGGDVKLISITSCFPNEGKTTISIELSRELAEAGKKVLLIDADMRNSRVVQKHTRAKGIKGLSQLLSGQISLTEALYETQYKGFFVIFVGQTPPNPVELFNSSKFKSLLRSAGEIFDYVLIDTPPLGMVIDAAVIASQTDSSMLILDAGKISYRVAQSVYKQLVKSGSRVIGAVLNNVYSKKSKYGGYGGYGKYGYGRYGYGYGRYGYGRYGYGKDPAELAPNTDSETSGQDSDKA